jgi:hydrogenase maturation protease
MKTAIIGIGNTLMSDDGAGVRVLEFLSPPPKGVKIIELATGGMTLLHKFEGLDTAIIIDAVDFGGKPGEVRVFKPEDVTSIKTVGYSLHDLDILKVLELARQMGTMPKNVFIAAIQPGCLEMGEGLSAEVESALPELAARIRQLLE